MRQTYEDLSKRLLNLIERYESFLKNEEHDYTRANILYGVIEISNKQKNSFELRVGTRRFLVKGDIKLSLPLCMVYLQTFEIVPNLDAYPGEKLVHIKELDIALSPHGNRFFKKINSGQNSFLTDPTVIREFNSQYTDHLWLVIQNMEKADTPEMDKI